MCRFCAEQSVNLPEEAIIWRWFSYTVSNNTKYILKLYSSLLTAGSRFMTATIEDPLKTQLLPSTEVAYNSQKAIGPLLSDKRFTVLLLV